MLALKERGHGSQTAAGGGAASELEVLVAEAQAPYTEDKYGRSCQEIVTLVTVT